MGILSGRFVDTGIGLEDEGGCVCISTVGNHRLHRTEQSRVVTLHWNLMVYCILRAKSNAELNTKPDSAAFCKIFLDTILRESLTRQQCGLL